MSHEKRGSDSEQTLGPPDEQKPSNPLNSDAEKAVVQPKPAPPGSDAPDGGLTAWLVVLGGWCTAFCSFGWLNSTFMPWRTLALVQPSSRYGCFWSIIRSAHICISQVLECSRNITSETCSVTTQKAQYHGFPHYRSSLSWEW